MTTFGNLAISILDPTDMTTNLGNIDAATYAKGTRGFDRIGGGEIRVPVGATNSDLLVEGNIVYARSLSSLAAPATALSIAVFIIDKVYKNIPGNEITASGPDLLEELKWRSIGEDIIADTLDATLSATVTPTEVNTTLASTASGGADTISITSATNFNFGQDITIELDSGDTFDTTITDVTGTTITLADTLPSIATSGNAVTTMTGFVLPLTGLASSFQLGRAVYVELDDGTEHVGSVLQSSTTEVTIYPGLPSVATSGNAAYQYTAEIDAINYLFTTHAPANWDAPIITGPTFAQIFGANETVFETLVLATQRPGYSHFRLVVENPPARQIEWMGAPDASPVTTLLIAGGDEPDAVDPDIGIVRSFDHDKSEQVKRVTRIYTRGANGLKITPAEPYITVDADYTVDWEGGVIIASAAEASGVTRVDRYVPFEDIQATGNSQAQIVEAAVILYEAAFSWLEDQDAPNPNFYNVTCTVHQHIPPFSTIDLVTTGARVELNLTDLVIHEVTHEMNAGGEVLTHLKLGGRHSWQARRGEDWQSDQVRRADTAFRHMGSPYAQQGGVLASTGHGHDQYLLDAVGALSASGQIATMNTPGTVTPSSLNDSTVENHTHAATGFAEAADLHDPATIGVGGLSAKLSITAGQVLTLANIAYSELTGLPDLSSLHARQHVITSALDHTVTGAALDVVGLSATNTLGILTPSANPGAASAILKSDASGHLQLVRLGAGIAPTVPLHASSATNASAVQIEAASLTTAPALNIDNLPLSTDVNSGRAIQIKATGESFGRLMLFSDGKIGTGPGSANRDTYLSRAAANTWLISSDGSTGAGHLQLNSTGWVGLGSAKGRLVFTDTTDDEIRIRDANLYFHDGTTDRLVIRRSGDSTNVEADIRAHSALGLAGEVEVVCFIDCNNDSSTAAFIVAKDAENITAATELFRVSEAGFMGLMETANADMTIGLTINQGANDNHILALKSSDVAHGVTALVETDTFSFHRKLDGATGGLDMWGLSEDTTGIRFVGVATNGDTTRSTAAVAPIRLQANKKSGTGVGVMGTDENLVVAADSGNARFIVDREGDIHMDATSNINAWDDYDDIALITALRGSLVPELKARYGDMVREMRPILQAGKIMTFNDHPGGDGSIFLNLPNAILLTMDGLRQIYEQIDGRLSALEERLSHA